jgi:plastocyanin
MKRLRSLALVTTVSLVLAACSAGSGSRGPAPSVDADALRIAARNSAFSTRTLSAKADEPFQIAFDNQDGAPHNVAIYRDAAPGDKVFGADPFGGPAVVVYDVPALQAGMYVFRCDIHTNMAGQLTVS